VQRKAAVITASSPTRTYGDPVPVVSPLYAGLVNGEAGADIVSTAPTCSTTYTATTPVAAALADRTTSCAGAVAANYSFGYATGAIVIGRKGVMITASSITPTYGDAAPTVTASYDGFVNGQTQATAGVMTTLPTCTTTYSSSTTVAAGGTTSCSGAVAGNYSFSYTAGTATVQRRVVTITASSPTVTYGDAIPSIAVASTAGWKAGESSAVLSAQPTCSTTYSPTTEVAAVLADRTTSCTGAVAANYSFAYADGAVTVQRRLVTITASSPTVTYGDAVPAVTPSYALVNSETSTVLSAQPTCSTTYTATTPVAAVLADRTTSCTGAAAGNYSFAYTSGVVTVQRRVVTITASSHTVAYGAAVPTVSVASYANWRTGESSTALSTQPTCSTTYTVTTPVAAVLADRTTSCAGAVAANYSFSYTSGAVTVQQRSIVITASSPSVTYGDAVPTVTPSYTLVNSETSTALSTQPTCSTAYAPTSAFGTSPSTSCSGAVAANYSFTYTNGSVAIAKKGVMITASSTSAASRARSTSRS
ncbi:MAG: MBG domain-containing protein, partial [Actinomycetota bacterium]